MQLSLNKPNQLSAVSNLKKKLQKLTLSNLNNLKVGLTLSLILQPLDVMRTSNIIKSTETPKKLLDLVKFIRKTEGVRGFFRGGMLSCLKTSMSFTLFFHYIEKFQKKQYGVLPINVENFLSAAAARTITTMVLSPVIVLKTRVEVVGANNSFSGNVKSIVKNEGMKGFYRGIFPTLCRDVPYSGIQFTLYRNLQKVFMRLTGKKPQDVYCGSFTVGGISSMLAILTTYPFDNIRIRSQVSTGKRENIISISKNIFNNEGIKGFYKGYQPRILKKMLGGAIAWSFYEMFNEQKKSKSIC